MFRIDKLGCMTIGILMLSIFMAASSYCSMNASLDGSGKNTASGGPSGAVVGESTMLLKASESRHSLGSTSRGNLSSSVSISGCQRTVDDFMALAHGLSIPESLNVEEPVKVGDEFDVNRYFDVLRNLSMEPGYLLDYVYYREFMGAEPVIYARRSEGMPYRNYSAYMESTGANSLFSNRSDYTSHVMVDGTPQGFFQLALLRIMGGQFYLSWHANYNDHTVVCDKENALALLRDQYWEQQVPDQGIMDNASRIDYAPSVELNDTSATVSLVTFSKWGGFLQRNMTFARSFPHVMQNESDRVLIEYNCGIAF